MSTRLPLQGRTNIGPAMARDLEQLGISTVEQLASQDPKQMYDRMCDISGSRQDPCVLDTYMAIVHNAKTGEKRSWWSFTQERKARFGQLR